MADILSILLSLLWITKSYFESFVDIRSVNIEESVVFFVVVDIHIVVVVVVDVVVAV